MDRKYERLLKSLTPQLRQRFERLRERCLHLVDMAGRHRDTDTGSLEALERLLWGYLRMLHGAQSLSEFVEHTDGDGIRRRIADLDRRLERLPKGDDPESVRLRAVLEDDLRTTRERAENIDDAQKKLEEIQRKKNEIKRRVKKATSNSESFNNLLRLDKHSKIFIRIRASVPPDDPTSTL